MGLYYNFYFILPEIYILLSICFLILIGVIFSSNQNFGYPILFTNFGYIFLQILIFSIILLLSQKPTSIFLWNNLINSDYFSYFTKLILFIVSFIWAFLSLNSNNLLKKINVFEYWILILLNIVALCFLLQSCDLLSIYLSIEFQSLIFYILASLNRTSEFSTESGLKYFILGAFSSAFLLFGITLLYFLTGTTNLHDFAKLFSGITLNDSNLLLGLLLGLFFITISLLFKLSAAPFHFWTPDVYDGAFSTITAYFVLAPKIVITGILIKLLLFSFHDFLIYWREFLLFPCLLSSLVGVLGAFIQTKWKRFIAYSSISHISFILLTLITGDLESITSAFFYLIVYLLMSSALFIVVTNLTSYKFPNIIQLRFINSICSLNSLNPLLAFSLLIILFSMAGIPPLAGFFSKFFVFFAALKIKSFGLSIILVVFSCLASFYYIRFIKLIYFTPVLTLPVVIPMNKSNSIFLALSTFVLVLLFLDLNFFLNIAKLMSMFSIKI